jgi:hypothetical protein
MFVPSVIMLRFINANECRNAKCLGVCLFQPAPPLELWTDLQVLLGATDLID